MKNSTTLSPLYCPVATVFIRHMPYSSIGHVMYTDLVATGQYSGDNVFMHHMPHTKKYQVTERGYYREYQMAR